MILKNASVLNKDFEFTKKDVLIKDSKIVKIENKGVLSGSNEVDLYGLKLIPGLINNHIHGCIGFDTIDANINQINQMSEFLARGGVTSFLPTTTTMPFEVLEKSVSSVAEAKDNGTKGAYILGINLEGPFLSKDFRGAHQKSYLRSASIEEFSRLQEAARGNIKITTIAPEVDGADLFIRRYSKDVVVSLGHTGADYSTCLDAIENGAKLVTHLFSAMPSLHHRNKTLIAAAFEKELAVEMICDGIHINSSVVKMAYKIFGPDKIVLITDSMSATGLSDGEYSLGGLKVFVKDKKAVNIEGRIAGGTSTLIECIKNVVSWGVPVNMAIKMATHNPAKVLGISDKKGCIDIGMDADLVAIDDNLDVKVVIIGGRTVDF